MSLPKLFVSECPRTSVAGKVAPWSSGWKPTWTTRPVIRIPSLSVSIPCQVFRKGVGGVGRKGVGTTDAGGRRWIGVFRERRRIFNQHHQVVVGTRKGSELARFHWVNTQLGNLKSTIQGTYHGFNFAKAGRR